MKPVLEDAYVFFDMLAYRYNICMFEKGSNRNESVFLGEAYSNRGERFVVYIRVALNSSIVQVYNMTGSNRVCVFQKKYSTLNDKKALSKSTSLFNFLDRSLFCKVIG